MEKVIIGIALLLIILLHAQRAIAQTKQDSVLYRVTTKDGNEYIGKILSGDTSSIQLSTENLGEISINQSDILTIIPFDAQRMKDGKYWFENPQAARYFWAPNGYGLRRGEVYYQNVWVLYNQLSVGVTDYFSMGGGLIPLFLFSGASTPVWITPKFSIPINEDKVNLGVGALLATVLGGGAGGLGLVYGMTTFGSRDSNISFGLGYGYSDGSWADAPIINVSGMARLGNRGYIVTENYYLSLGDEHVLLFSFGGRSIIKRAGLDYGLFLPLSNEMGSFFAFPWLGLTLPFGKVR